MFGGLVAVHDAQETMGVAYQRMAGSLQQSLQMMQQMNGAWFKGDLLLACLHMKALVG